MSLFEFVSLFFRTTRRTLLFQKNCGLIFFRTKNIWLRDFSQINTVLQFLQEIFRALQHLVRRCCYFKLKATRSTFGPEMCRDCFLKALSDWKLSVLLFKVNLHIQCYTRNTAASIIRRTLIFLYSKYIHAFTFWPFIKNISNICHA